MSYFTGQVFEKIQKNNYGAIKSADKKNRSAKHTCQLMLSFIPFDWSLFLKVSIREFSCYK